MKAPVPVTESVSALLEKTTSLNFTNNSTDILIFNNDKIKNPKKQFSFSSYIKKNQLFNLTGIHKNTMKDN